MAAFSGTPCAFCAPAREASKQAERIARKICIIHLISRYSLQDKACDVLPPIRWISEAHDIAVTFASVDTNIIEEDFPAECPYTLEELMADVE